MGGAGAVQIMEQLIAGGAREIIAAGCCGALVEDIEGYSVVEMECASLAACAKMRGVIFGQLLFTRKRAESPLL